MTRPGRRQAHDTARVRAAALGSPANLCAGLLVTLAMAGCGASPERVLGPGEPIIVLSPPPVAIVSATLAPSAAVPVAVLRDSATAKAEANRYVAWEGSSPANIRTLAVLTARVTQSIGDMRRSLAHGRYGAKQVQAARAATDALHVFLQNKGD